MRKVDNRLRRVSTRLRVDDLAQGGPAGHRCADLGVEVLHRAAPVSRQWLLHLHRLEYHDQVAGLDDVTISDRDLDDRALHG